VIQYGLKYWAGSNSLFWRENSLLFEKYSLIRLQKFPVPLRWEFGCKPMDLLVEWT
jgi:hypothetical protein